MGEEGGSSGSPSSLCWASSSLACSARRAPPQPCRLPLLDHHSPHPNPLRAHARTHTLTCRRMRSSCCASATWRRLTASSCPRSTASCLDASTLTFSASSRMRCSCSLMAASWASFLQEWIFGGGERGGVRMVYSWHAS
jgi:hypothetical protein